MRFFSRSFLLVVLLATPLTVALTAFAQGGRPELVNLPSLLELKRSGVGDDLLVMVINKAKRVDFDTSAQGIATMKQAGLSDVVIRAAVARQTSQALGSSESAPAGPTQANAEPASTLPDAVMRQNGTATPLNPGMCGKTFIQSNAKDWSDAASRMGPAMAGVLTPAAIHPAGGLASLGVGIWALGRKQTFKGFEVQFLRGKHANTLLAAAPAEIFVPFAPLADGKYAAAEPMLFRLEALPRDEARVIATRKGAIKHKLNEVGEPNFEGEPYRYSSLSFEPVKTAQGLTARLPALAPGDYALGFVFEHELLPAIFDFMVR